MKPTLLRRKNLRNSSTVGARRPKLCRLSALSIAASTRSPASVHESRQSKQLGPGPINNCIRCRTAAATPPPHHMRRTPVTSAAAASANGASHSTVGSAAAGSDNSTLTVSVKVVVPYHPTSHGQQLVLVGGCETLGDWNTEKGVRLEWCEGHSHVAEVELPIHFNIPCKLVVLGHSNQASWEPEANRELLIAPSSLASRAAGYTVICHWGFPECTQLLSNSLRRGGGSASSSNGSSSRSSSSNSHNGNLKANGHSARSSTAAAYNPLIAGVKKALAHASSRDIAVIANMTSSWEEESREKEEDTVPVQCQVTVLVPKNGPKLKPEQSLVLVGSSAALGRWEPERGLPMERIGEDSPMWVAQAELPLDDGLQAKVVVVDSVSGEAQIWEPCENRSLARFRGGSRPVLITAYWGAAPTHCMEVDRLSPAVAATSPQVVQLLRQQLAATSSQLDGLRRERDEARKAIAVNEEQSLGRGGQQGRLEMVQLAEQLQTTRQLYEVTKKEATNLGGTVGVTRQLCDAAKRELVGLATQLESAKRAYEALAPQVEKMEKQLLTTTKAFEATQPELRALEAQLERARSLLDRTLRKIEAAKRESLTAAGEIDANAVVRRRSIESSTRVREVQFAKL